MEICLSTLWVVSRIETDTNGLSELSRCPARLWACLREACGQATNWIKLCTDSSACIVFITFGALNEQHFYIWQVVYTYTLYFPVVCRWFQFMILGNEQESRQDSSNVCGMSTFRGPFPHPLPCWQVAYWSCWTVCAAGKSCLIRVWMCVEMNLHAFCMPSWCGA